jgi:hypothetical protein
MRLLYRKISIDSIIDREQGVYIQPVSLELDQGNCAAPTAFEVASKYNPNPNYGQLKTDYIYFTIPIYQNALDIGLYYQEPFITSGDTSNEPYDFFTRKVGIPLETYLTHDYYFLTGQTESRLDEIDFYGNPLVNTNYDDVVGSFTGFLQRTPSNLIYVVNAEDVGGYIQNTGVKYYESLVEKRLVYDTKIKDTIEINLVNFEAKAQGLTVNNSSLEELVKDDRLFGISAVTEIENDINIDRGRYNVFENHFILGEVNSLIDLTNYRNNYFKLV